MSSFKRSCLYLAALAVLFAAGAVNGTLTGRWSGSADLKNKAARLDRVPMTVGAWEGRSLPLDERTREQAGIAGYLMRRYEDGRHRAVTALLVCGRPGPIAAHTPEVCYPGNGYEPAAPRVRISVGPGSPPDEFWASEFSNQDAALSKQIRVLYAWSTDGTWRANERLRFRFSGAETLFKLYVVREMGKGEDKAQDDPALAFLDEFLPQLRTVLFPAP